MKHVKNDQIVFETEMGDVRDLLVSHSPFSAQAGHDSSSSAAPRTALTKRRRTAAA